MFTLKNFRLSDINSSTSPLKLLYRIFCATLNPNFTYREFMQYYFAQHPDEMDFTLIYEANNLVGFYSAAFYPRKIDNKTVIICRSAMGMQKSMEKGRFPLAKLFYSFARYKLAHPFTPVYITGFMANPLMYAMICKYTQTVYPRRLQKVPSDILQFKNELLLAMGLSKKEVSAFVLKIHFQVFFSADDIKRFESSTNPDVQYYLSINPGYREQKGVMVLIPVTTINILYTCTKRLQTIIKKRTIQGVQKTIAVFKLNDAKCAGR